MLQGLFQIAVTLVLLVLLVPLFGGYMARVYRGERVALDLVMSPVERLFYWVGGVDATQQMSWWPYARAVLWSNGVMAVLVFAILMFQGALPLNPTGLGAASWDTNLHTTISFITNTDQQHYSGETTYSYFSQIFGLEFFMFTSAATGLAVGIAFIRGISGKPLGNFYVDLTRSILWVLLPLSVIFGLILIAFGLPQTLDGPAVVTSLEGATQVIARGPVAAFEIIKELGENGGGFMGINSAHPFENANGATNLIETLALLSVPTALIYTYGVISENRKQAWVAFWMVFLVFVVLVVTTAAGEYDGNPIVNGLLGGQAPNLEGKEVRIGWAQMALFAVSTTATMCGAVNGMHDSLLPPGGFATLTNLFLQVVWGGQGTGTAYLYIYFILAVFVTGLMVGRTPEFLARKIEKREVVLASVILLVHPFVVLLPGAITLAFHEQLAGISNSGFHGVSQVIYEYTSAAANNGSGFEGLADSEPAATGLWWNLSTLVPLLAGRYLPMVALLALAGGMSAKKTIPETVGTLRTDTSLFGGVTAGVILILGLLEFFPVLVLGPVAEAVQIAQEAAQSVVGVLP